MELLIISVIKVALLAVVVLTLCAYATLLERRVVASMQQRMGPITAGPWGLLTPLADAVKMIFKEDITPKYVEGFAYKLAPIVAFIPAMMSFAVIPFFGEINVFGYQINGVISDLNIGVLWIFATTSLGIYGIILAGWSSGSKYSLLGGLRSSAQMISYEIAYGLSIIGVVLIADTLSLTTLVNQQGSDSELFFFQNWYIWKQPLGFMLYLTCAIAETNRAPFDLPEAESELTGGYHTEYSSMRFGMFFIAEYANMIAVSCVATTLFLGGWTGPGPDGIWWYFLKVLAVMIFYIWLRATFPRFRYDQLMSFGWKVLFPLALLNTLITGFFVVWNQ
jgi:NADH-quinone oxidoreductase subunit H